MCTLKNRCLPSLALALVVAWSWASLGLSGADFSDDFAVNQATITGTGSSTQDGAMTGGERDLQVSAAAGTMSAGIGGGTLVVTGDGAANGTVTLVWDGNDNDASNLANTGLGGLNLSASADAFLIGIQSLSGSPTLTLTVFSGGNSSFVPLGGLTASPLPQVVRVAFATLIGTADLANVGAVQLQISGLAGASIKLDFIRTGSSAAPAVVEATLTDVLLVDNDGNGRATPGDTLRYVVRITNTGAGTLNNVQFNAPALANTSGPTGLGVSPVARDEAPGSTSAPGDPFHTAFNTTLTVLDGDAGQDLLNNDFLGTPAAAITRFGGGTLGGTVDSNAAGATANSGGHSLTVNANGSFTYVPATGFTGLFTFQYRLANASGSDTATVTVAVGLRPSADTDSFAVTGNTMLDSTLISESVLAGDSGDALTISASTGVAHGSLSFTAGTGHFTYTPTAGYTGADSFTYTVGNGFGNVVATVNLTVANRVWYIDNSAAVNGDGRSSSPFQQTSNFTTVNDGAAGHPGDNDLIFLREGSGNYTGGITLRAGQKLIGDGASGSLNGTFGITFASGSAKAAGVALPSFTGTDPVIVNTAAGGHGIVLNSGNTVRGLTVGNTPNGFGFRGTSVGNLVISESSKTGTGGAVDLTQGSGSVTISFETLSSDAATAEAIKLANLAGTLTAGAGAIGASTGPSGTAISISGGSATITYPGSITKNSAGRLMDIQNRTGGTVTFSGILAHTHASVTGILCSGNSGGTIQFSGALKILNTGANGAVTLTSNTGATINFTGGNLDIDTTSGAGFTATGGGTVSVAGGGNSITSTSATALNMANTTIAAGGLNFVSISAGNNTAAADPVNGIVLLNTGASGGLSVTGDGGGSNNGSGGTIQNVTGNSIDIDGAINVSLGYMSIQNSGADGINVDNINGFTLHRSTIVDNSSTSGLNHNGIRFGNFSTGTAVNGTITISNCSVTYSPHDNLAVGIGSGTSTWSITGSVFSFSGGDGSGDGSADVAGNNGVNLEIRNAATVPSFTFTGNTMEGNYADGMQIAPASGATGSLVATISNNTWRNNNLHLDLNAVDAANMTFTVSNNSFINTTRRAVSGVDGASHAVNVFQGTPSSGTLNLRFENNTIGDNAVAGSGSSFGNGLRANFNANGQGRVLINGNNVYETPVGRGIEVIGRNGNGQLDVTLTANTVDHTNTGFNPGTSDFPLAAIFVQSHETAAGSSTHYRVRSDIRGNTVPAGSAFDLVATYLAVMESQASGSSSTHELVDNSPASANATAELTESHTNPAHNNTGSASANAGVSLIAGPIATPP